LGRTYQQVRLFDALTVAENIAMGAEAGLAGANPIRQLGSGRRVREQIGDAATTAEAICGVASLRNLRPPQLSTGQRRMVELARAVAGGFKVLLLDEPSSGLDRNETRAMGRIFRALVEEHGLAILCVEHDMALVMSVCDYIHVIDFGRPIFEGTPGEVGRSEIVRAAYLGSDAVEEAS
jgi:ABC-type branched-subunit amino acid transport system ATPase component